jgi:hypothetical protein
MGHPRTRCKSTDWGLRDQGLGKGANRALPTHVVILNGAEEPASALRRPAEIPGARPVVFFPAEGRDTRRLSNEPAGQGPSSGSSAASARPRWLSVSLVSRSISAMVRSQAPAGKKADRNQTRPCPVAPPGSIPPPRPRPDVQRPRRRGPPPARSGNGPCAQSAGTVAMPLQQHHVVPHVGVVVGIGRVHQVPCRRPSRAERTPGSPLRASTSSPESSASTRLAGRKP